MILQKLRTVEECACLVGARSGVLEGKSRRDQGLVYQKEEAEETRVLCIRRKRQKRASSDVLNETGRGERTDYGKDIYPGTAGSN